MFKLDKEDIKAIARRRAKKTQLVKVLDGGFFVGFGLIILLLLLTYIPSLDTEMIFGIAMMVAIAGLGDVIAFTIVWKIRERRLFKVLEKQAGLVKIIKEVV